MCTRAEMLLALASMFAMVACSPESTAPDIARLDSLGFSALSNATADAGVTNVDEPQSESCSFDRGTTTCVATAEHTEFGTHSTYSGCVAGPPPFHPGRRVTTYEDTYLVTVTTTTYRHGHHGRIYDTQTTEERSLVSSRQISSVCEAI